jgi:hypothetical protein
MISVVMKGLNLISDRVDRMGVVIRPGHVDTAPILFFRTTYASKPGKSTLQTYVTWPPSIGIKREDGSRNIVR